MRFLLFYGYGYSESSIELHAMRNDGYIPQTLRELSIANAGCMEGERCLHRFIDAAIIPVSAVFTRVFDGICDGIYRVERLHAINERRMPIVTWKAEHQLTDDRCTQC